MVRPAPSTVTSFSEGEVQRHRKPRNHSGRRSGRAEVTSVDAEIWAYAQRLTREVPGTRLRIIDREHVMVENITD